MLGAFDHGAESPHPSISPPSTLSYVTWQPTTSTDTDWRKTTPEWNQSKPPIVWWSSQMVVQHQTHGMDSLFKRRVCHFTTLGYCWPTQFEATSTFKFTFDLHLISSSCFSFIVSILKSWVVLLLIGQCRSELCDCVPALGPHHPWCESKGTVLIISEQKRELMAPPPLGNTLNLCSN